MFLKANCGSGSCNRNKAAALSPLAQQLHLDEPSSDENSKDRIIIRRYTKISPHEDKSWGLKFTYVTQTLLNYTNLHYLTCGMCSTSDKFQWKEPTKFHSCMILIFPKRLRTDLTWIQQEESLQEVALEIFQLANWRDQCSSPGLKNWQQQPVQRFKK